MGRIFDLDSPVMQWLTKASHVFFCGIFFLVCCLPVITIGASCTAMYKMMFNLREDKGTGAIDFFKVFVRELRTSTVLWILDLLAMGIVLGSFYLILRSGKEGIVLYILMLYLFLVFFVWAFSFSYVFAYTAYFRNTVPQTVKNSFFMAVTHRKETIPVLFLSVLPLLGYMISPYYFVILLPGWVFLALPAIFYGRSGFLLRVFASYRDEEE